MVDPLKGNAKTIVGGMLNYISIKYELTCKVLEPPLVWYIGNRGLEGSSSFRNRLSIYK